MIRVYDAAGRLTETYEHGADFKDLVKVKDGPAKNRCNYDYSGLRLLAVAKHARLPPGTILRVRNLGGAEIMFYIRRLSHTAVCFENVTAEGNNSTSTMKKKSTSKSAFFNLRVLIASLLCLFGVFVALLGSGAFSICSPRQRARKTISPQRGRMPPAHKLRTSCKWLVPSEQPQICDTSLIFPTRGKLKSDV